MIRTLTITALLVCSACAHETVSNQEPLIPEAVAQPSPPPSAKEPPKPPLRSFETKTLGEDQYAHRSAPKSATSTPASESTTRSNADYGNKNPNPPTPGTPLYGDFNPNPPSRGTPQYGDPNPSPPSRGTPRYGDPNPSPPGR